MRFSEPSPFPIVVGSALVELTPAAGTHIATARAAKSTCALLIRFTARLPPCRFHRCAPAAIGGGRASPVLRVPPATRSRSEEHTSEFQSPDTISYAVFCLKKKKKQNKEKSTFTYTGLKNLTT